MQDSEITKGGKILDPLLWHTTTFLSSSPEIKYSVKQGKRNSF